MRTPAVRIVGAAVICTVIVALALGALDASPRWLSTPAVKVVMTGPVSESSPTPVTPQRQQIALASPTEPASAPASDSVADIDSVPTATVTPEAESPPPPKPESAATEEEAAAVPAVPLPRAAPKRPPLPRTPAQRLKLTAKARVKAERCLAQAVYFESRGEPLRGQLAVAQVVMNRVFSPFYPNDVCGVVYQNANQHLACQFTFACDGIPERVNDWHAWRRAEYIAKQTLDGKVWVREVARSTHFHAYYVHPYWVREMKRMVRYGAHTFYRPRKWGNGAGEINWSSISHIAARTPIIR
jgi:spore germination cell wall hydrolase CwlJ-like protein